MGTTTGLTDHPALVRSLEEARALDGPADQLAKPTARALQPGPLKDLLSGTWLGHPVHPMLTDVPVGSWTAAFLLDVLGGKEGRKAADRCIGVGVLTAVPTAVAGLSDWMDTGGATRRIGLGHAVGNTAALICYGASYLARRRGRRVRGLLLSFVGAGFVTVSAYLGGHLTYRKGVGVDRNTFTPQPSDWTPVLPADRLADGQPVHATTDGLDVMLLKHGGSISAIGDRCNHRGGPLHEGTVEDGVVACPWHGSRFQTSDGSVVGGPAIAPQPAYDVRVQDGMVEVRARIE